MSYILDALRRADAERRRGQAPVLHEVAGLPQLAPRSTRRAPWQRLAPWLGLAVAVMAVLLAASWLLRPSGHADAGKAVAATPAPRAPDITPAPPLQRPPPAPLPPAPVVRPPPMSPPTSPVLVPSPAAGAAPQPASQPAAARPIPASALPEPQRGAVARLAFGGAVHSAERSQSFVLLGGQIVREGETLAPGIVLDRIAPRALVLRVGEQLVELPL